MWGSSDSTHSPPTIVARVELVVSYRPSSVRFFAEYSGFPLSLKTNMAQKSTWLNMFTLVHFLEELHE